MEPIQRKFINELGNQIEMSVVSNETGITIFAKGPTSDVEHTWTPLEIKNLREMLSFEDTSWTTVFRADRHH